MKKVRNREARREQCAKCKGSGGKSYPKITTCDRCGGKGWIEPQNSQEVICPKCNGAGKAKTREKINCVECSGKGSAIRIIETVSDIVDCSFCLATGKHDTLVLCDKCTGLGKIETESDNSNECALCGGTGTLEDQEYDDCPQCRGTGRIPQYVLCPRCRGARKFVNVDQCPYCDGMGYHLVGEPIEIDITPSVKK
jgi:DnaJ-class molecular chaperone